MITVEHPTQQERSQYRISSRQGIEIGLGVADPLATAATKLAQQYPDHLVLMQAGKFLHGQAAFAGRPVAMRGLLLTYTEKVLTLESKVEELSPKAAALDRIETVSDESFCLRDAAKLLQIPERQFLQKLHKKNFIYPPEGGGWRAYSEKLKEGLLEHKIRTGQKGDGSEWTSTQVRVTARGMAKLAVLLENDRGQH